MVGSPTPSRIVIPRPMTSTSRGLKYFIGTPLFLCVWISLNFFVGMNWFDGIVFTEGTVRSPKPYQVYKVFNISSIEEPLGEFRNWNVCYLQEGSRLASTRCTSAGVALIKPACHHILARRCNSCVVLSSLHIFSIFQFLSYYWLIIR